jgi:uncharacterized protein involved in exopolysaccharide biosynthesis
MKSSDLGLVTRTMPEHSYSQSLAPDRDGVASAADSAPSEVSPLRMINFVLRNRRAIILIPLLIGLLVAVGNLFTTHYWRSSASFMPQAASKNPGAKIAQEFGVDLSSGDDAQNSPMFYVSLLTSRPLLSAAVLNKYSFVSGKETISGNLIELLDVGGKSEGRRLLNAMEELNQDLSVSADIRTGVVNLTVKTPWAVLSKAVLDKLLADVNEFNSKIRRSRAGAERDFVTSQVDAARAELRKSEDRLQAFNMQNRNWQNDASLVAEHERIAREVNLLNLRYTTLTQNLDQAAIDAVRNTPVLTIIEPPVVAVKPEGRGTVVRALLGVIASAVIGTLYALFREYGRRSDETGSEDFQQFKAYLTDVRSDMRRFFRRGRRQAA